ncbi:MAG TPA: bacillithiol biosynthesis cysteine-adding enzyme BshC [Bryobacteraceae bacterium]|jgi:bacillithiol biosynthesis cysteine-adding enzyme BshC|nr:bacillithiol biosynthesis cysteine-adding enzyme BshC [Bryobacteraceae bacterium]
MHCSCVRQTDLPNTTALAADTYYHPDRTAAFYRHPLRDLDSFRAAAAEIHFSDEKRAAAVAALRKQNGDSPALARLAKPGTVVVATGQQVGLFSGPAYTIYKALHAARLAEWLTANGIPAVPVFWVATEDHDFAEVNHTWVFDAHHRPIKLEMRRSASAQPVGAVTLAAPPVNELRSALHGMPFGEEVADLVEEAYRTGNTMGGAFGELLRKLLGKFDIPQLDPMLPEFRALAAPALGAAVEAHAELTSRVMARNRELLDAGYHTQVHVEQETSFVFLLENGKRLALRRTGSEFGQNGRRFSTEELKGRAASLSPNALLRPVVQDSILPTAACIMGPAEAAYLAQSEVLYSAILGRMPVVVPRSGFTVLDAHSEKLMTRYGLSLPDFSKGEELLRERIATRLVPPSLHGALADTATTVNQAIEHLGGELLRFDPTLARALERSRRKISHQISKIEGKAGREAMRRDERATGEAASLYGLIFPERHLQERLYSILPFLAKHGLDLVEHIYEAIELECPDHRMMVV